MDNMKVECEKNFQSCLQDSKDETRTFCGCYEKYNSCLMSDSKCGSVLIGAPDVLQISQQCTENGCMETECKLPVSVESDNYSNSSNSLQNPCILIFISIVMRLIL